MATAADKASLVIYPKTPLPLDKLYQTILLGIQRTLNHRIEPYVMANPDKLLTELPLSPKYQSVIALGEQASRIIGKSNYQGRLIASNWVIDPKRDYRGISLAMDDRILRRQLKILLPHIQRVHLVQGVVESIHVAKKQKQLPGFINHTGLSPIDQLKTLVQLINKLSPQDALVIPNQIEPDYLYRITEMAWDNHVALLTTNVSHLETGALLCFMPNYVALGEQIGQYVQHDRQSLDHLNRVDIGLNRKIAGHLGIAFNDEQLRHIKIQVK